MNVFLYIAPWVFGSVAVGIVVGFVLGRNVPERRESDEPSAETQEVLKMLLELLGAAERIENNVEHHNTEIEENAREIDKLHVTEEMKVVKDALMHHMATLVESNEHLREELVCTRYRLEEQAQEIDHVRHEARSDELTGVCNRKAFDEKLHLLLDDWRRKHEPFVLILTDLDYFKRVNDSHGHQVGDHVLKMAGDGLKELARECDFVGRYGGDEFAIMLPKVTQDVGLKVAQRICRGIADALCLSVQGIEVSVTFSMGVTAARDGDTDESIFKRADQALYHAKQKGRNRVILFQESDQQSDAETPMASLA
jgi:diguanylate cyclase